MAHTHQVPQITKGQVTRARAWLNTIGISQPDNLKQIGHYSMLLAYCAVAPTTHSNMLVVGAQVMAHLGVVGGAISGGINWHGRKAVVSYHQRTGKVRGVSLNVLTPRCATHNCNLLDAGQCSNSCHYGMYHVPSKAYVYTLLDQGSGKATTPQVVKQDIKLWHEASSSRELLQNHAQAVTRLASQLDMDLIERMGQALEDARRNGHTVYCMGNGGSAAIASHLVTDLAWGRRAGEEERPRAISLVSNVPLMTALSNDVGYTDLFVEQLKGLFQKGDVVVAISSSGNSENVLRAIRYGNEHGGVSLGLVGFDGGKMKDTCHLCLHVPTPIGAYEVVEDVHHAVCHMLSSYIKYVGAHPSMGSVTQG